MEELTHFDETGAARMVDVSAKPPTVREAVARGRISMRPATLAAIREQRLKKGDALAVARVAGIQAAKETARLIPLCHTLPLQGVAVDFAFVDDASAPAIAPESTAAVQITARVRTTGATGVEMEALTAVSVAGLALYDMTKAIDRDLVIGDVRLDDKTGGQRGTYHRIPTI